MNSTDELTFEEKAEIIAEGYRAFIADYEESNNPYQSGSFEHELWIDGFEDASDDEREKSR